MTATDWIVIGGGALVGWGLVSWIITTVRQQRAPPVPMGPESSQAPAPEPTPAPPRGPLTLAELGSTWHMILGVSPNASLAEIEAVYEKRVAECERGGPGGAAPASERSRLDEAFQFIRTQRQPRSG